MQLNLNPSIFSTISSDVDSIALAYLLQSFNQDFTITYAQSFSGQQYPRLKLDNGQLVDRRELENYIRTSIIQSRADDQNIIVDSVLKELEIILRVFWFCNLDNERLVLQELRKKRSLIDSFAMDVAYSLNLAESVQDQTRKVYKVLYNSDMKNIQLKAFQLLEALDHQLLNGEMSTLQEYRVFAYLQLLHSVSNFEDQWLLDQYKTFQTMTKFYQRKCIELIDQVPYTESIWMKVSLNQRTFQMPSINLSTGTLRRVDYNAVGTVLVGVSAIALYACSRGIITLGRQ
ncbi:hypothetical protein MIR68_002016 [Amoeboaphelidium protococcarum]|nr:hypothetical protein MIR68_002016 [Amoeboaphelidium protococcarum]